MEAGVPADRGRTIPEMVAEPQTVAPGMLRRLAAAGLGSEITMPPAAFELTADSKSRDPPRRVSADTTALLEELGYDAARIAELASVGINTIAA